MSGGSGSNNNCFNNFNNNHNVDKGLVECGTEVQQAHIGLIWELSSYSIVSFDLYININIFQ